MFISANCRINRKFVERTHPSKRKGRHMTQLKNATFDPLKSCSCRKLKNLSSKTTPDPATQMRSLKRLPQPRRRTPSSQPLKVLLNPSTSRNHSYAGAQPLVSVFKCTPLRAAAAQRDLKILRRRRHHQRCLNQHQRPRTFVRLRLGIHLPAWYRLVVRLGTYQSIMFRPSRRQRIHLPRALRALENIVPPSVGWRLDSHRPPRWKLIARLQSIVR